MKKFLIIFFITLTPTLGFCELFKVGQKLVTTNHNDSVWAVNKSGLYAYQRYLADDGKIDIAEREALWDMGIIAPVKSGIVVLVTAVEANAQLLSGDNRLYTVYTVKIDGGDQYFKTFGIGLKTF